MFDRALDKASASAKSAARNAALGLIAGLTFTVGLAFLTVAAWLVLATLMPLFQVAAIIGAVYVGIACIVLAILLTRGKGTTEPAPVASPPPPSFDGLLGAFMTGMNAGAQARSARHPATERS
ncbi:hypothetical protein KDD17_13620 [Sulfitobacter albidus]|uniref:Phage holin family protein n=1 Tax=Sulfitobacter albidus TaxID=2829501 RepID=A0A975JCR5_9RHOB|nr:phage holin family protein [Sulfitobacter albidus]QUJ75957.1 hypothetical protein KDD17_13620 [Sulfitobacter albidus]